MHAEGSSTVRRRWSICSRWHLFPAGRRANDKVGMSMIVLSICKHIECLNAIIELHTLICRVHRHITGVEWVLVHCTNVSDCRVDVCTRVIKVGSRATP